VDRARNNRRLLEQTGLLGVLDDRHDLRRRRLILRTPVKCAVLLAGGEQLILSQRHRL
jgi:hypothetical protein